LKFNQCAIAGLALALSTGYTLSAFAQAKPETLVQERQAKMKLQGKYLYSIIPMANGKIPYDANIVARNAGFLAALEQMAWDTFDPRTEGVKPTRALPEIYKDPATFKAKQDALQAEIAKFQSAVKSGNEASIKAAINDTNKACNSCHDTFRAKQ
jgi:cytochrome c556